MSFASMASIAISAPKSTRFLAPFEPSITHAMLLVAPFPKQIPTGGGQTRWNVNTQLHNYCEGD